MPTSSLPIGTGGGLPCLDWRETGGRKVQIMSGKVVWRLRGREARGLPEGAGGAAAEDAQARQALVEEAGRRALAYKKQGFHCSESVFLAVNETLRITDPALVCAVTGFHGGGGTHRLRAGVDLTALLAAYAAGNAPADANNRPVEQVQHLCGALAAGIVCAGLLYGRRSPTDDLTCVDELCYELHRRFCQELGHNECRPLREIWVPKSEDRSCAPIYRKGAEIAVDTILRAHEIAPECAPFRPQERAPSS